MRLIITMLLACLMLSTLAEAKGRPRGGGHGTHGKR